MFKKDPCLTISNSPHSPHSIIQSLVNKESHLLDVGCNTGFLAKSLKKKNVTSDGIDINREALKIARKYCRNVFRRDLYLSKRSWSLISSLATFGIEIKTVPFFFKYLRESLRRRSGRGTCSRTSAKTM